MLPNYDNGITPHVNEYVHTRPLCKYLKSDYAHTSVIGGVYGGGGNFPALCLSTSDPQTVNKTRGYH